FDELRRGRDLEHPDIATPQRLRPLVEGARMAEQRAAIAKHLLAFACQHETAADPVEQLQTELLLERADLPRQCGLRDPQAQRRLGDGAELGNGNEGSRVAQVHTPIYVEPALV